MLIFVNLIGQTFNNVILLKKICKWTNISISQQTRDESVFLANVGSMLNFKKNFYFRQVYTIYIYVLHYDSRFYVWNYRNTVFTSYFHTHLLYIWIKSVRARARTYLCSCSSKYTHTHTHLQGNFCKRWYKMVERKWLVM